MDVAEQELQELYTWVDDIPLSRPKRNIARDFSDGVLLAEIVHHYYPKLVELHNYSSANATQQKLYNWNTLNGKVFRRLGFTLSKQEFEAAANCQPGSIERVLKLVKLQLAKCKDEGFTGVPTTPTLVPSKSVGASAGPPRPAPGTLPAALSVPAPKEAPAAHMHVHATSSLAPRTASAGPAAATVSHSTSRANDRASAGLVAEKDQTINELKETNEILETKVRKLEQLVRLKDAKIANLMAKLQTAGLA